MTAVTPARPAEDFAAFSPIADALARAVVSLDGDVALVVDDAGVITRVACSDAECEVLDAERWVGRAWIDTVSSETRVKVQKLLADAARTGARGAGR